MSHKLDSIEKDVDSHVAYFLSGLASNLGLEKIVNLTLTDPHAALLAIRQTQQAISSERSKAKALFQLSTGQPLNPSKINFS